MNIQKMSSALNHFIIIKFYVVETEIILIKKTDYFKHCLNIKISDIYEINIYIPAHLNRIGIIKILNIYQKLSVLKKNNIIIYNAMSSIIHDI